MYKTNDILEVSKEIDKLIRQHNSAVLKGNPNIYPLLKKWEDKKEIIKAIFKGEQILEKEVSIDKSGEILEKEIRNFRSQAIFENIYGNGVEIYPFLVKVSIEEMIKNEIDVEIKIGKLVVPKGMKFTRALKFFFDDKEMLDKMQTDYSKIMNQKKLRGKLCLSIHPMDFFTMSHNASNWRSCMATDGEYRAGILSYINDSTTAIAYLKNFNDNNDVLLTETDTLWNDKKWRQIVHIAPKQGIVTGKGYPYHSDDLTMAVLEWIEELLPEEKFQEEMEWISEKNPLLYKEDWNSSAYLDLDHTKNKCYVKPHIDIPLGKKSESTPFIEIGGESTCVCCHKQHVSSADSYACYDCSDGARCDCCGDLVFGGEVYMLDGEELCEWCYDEYARTCDSCGETYHRDSDYVCYKDDIEEYRCEDCFDEE